MNLEVILRVALSVPCVFTFRAVVALSATGRPACRLAMFVVVRLLRIIMAVPLLSVPPL
jgi:hypothetical protein